MSDDTIVYRVFSTPLGSMLGGATDKGCCLLEFEDRGGINRIKLRITKRYGTEPTKGNNRFVDQLEQEIKEYFTGSRISFTVPLDLKGTPFQRTVWQQLLAIPYGEIKTYGEIAKTLGKPDGSRAVGRANGDNYLAIVIPCHRVILADGQLRGYGGGLWRKKYLLDLESRTVSV